MKIVDQNVATHTWSGNGMMTLSLLLLTSFSNRLILLKTHSYKVKQNLTVCPNHYLLCQNKKPLVIISGKYRGQLFFSREIYQNWNLLSMMKFRSTGMMMSRWWNVLKLSSAIIAISSEDLVKQKHEAIIFIIYWNSIKLQPV